MRSHNVISPIPDDVHEAHELRDKDSRILEGLQRQSGYVTRLSNGIAFVTEARKYDHFGDSLEDSFTRKRK